MNRPFDSIAVVILDGVGCGEAKDCQETFPEDRGANSLLHASQKTLIEAPALQSMGLERVPGLGELKVKYSIPSTEVRGAFGAMEPTFPGKGSPEGHQALMGYEVIEPYLTFDRTGFPDDLIAAVEQEVSALLSRPIEIIRYPGTDDVSGTIFIEHPTIGPVHLQSKHAQVLKLPVYASSESLIQIAIHQEVLSQEVIEQIGKVVRERVCNRLGYRIGRVIMRPFIGSPGNFQRVPKDRRDFGVDPDGETVIDHLTAAGIPVYGIGKAANMLNNRGFPVGSVQKLADDFERIQAVKSWMQGAPLPNPLPRGEGGGGLTFANLNGIDELFGHRRNPFGYIDHIERLSQTIGEIQQTMNDRSLLIVTSDHGNDPTHTVRMDTHVKASTSSAHVARSHTNHTRERVPLLTFHRSMIKPTSLGIRQSFTDVAATIAENFGVREKVPGKSFLKDIL